MQLVFSKVCGPTTVGIDGSGAPETILDIIYDAFDFYGVGVARGEAVPSAASSVGDKRLSTGSSSSTESTASLNAHVAASHLEDSFPPGGNRRISMGVYGMFTK